MRVLCKRQEACDAYNDSGPLIVRGKAVIGLGSSYKNPWAPVLLHLHEQTLHLKPKTLSRGSPCTHQAEKSQTSICWKVFRHKQIPSQVKKNQEGGSLQITVLRM